MKLRWKLFISVMALIFVVALAIALFKKPEENLDQNLAQIYQQSISINRVDNTDIITTSGDDNYMLSQIDSTQSNVNEQQDIDDIILPDGSVVIPDEVHEMFTHTADDISSNDGEYLGTAEGESDSISDEEFESEFWIDWSSIILNAVGNRLEESDYEFLTQNFIDNYDSFVNNTKFTPLQESLANLRGTYDDEIENGMIKIFMTNDTALVLYFTLENEKIDTIIVGE